MFDGSLPEIGGFSALSDAELVAASAGWGRVESAAAARKLAAMAEVFRRRTGIEDAEERENWFIDPETSVLNDLAGAHHITEGLARSQTQRGVLLANRFPKVAALFQAGLITDLLIRAIVFRTYLITDPDAMAAVDAALAEQILTWGPKSQAKTEEAIDALVEIHDPGALRRREPATQTRNLEFGTMFDAPGFMTVHARVYTADGVALEERVGLMARSVCQDDPRPFKERLNDAFAALQSGTGLRCECDNPDCPATTIDGPSPNIVIHVITPQDALTHAQAAAGQSESVEPESGVQRDAGPVDVEPDPGAQQNEAAGAESVDAQPIDKEPKPENFAADCKPVNINPVADDLAGDVGADEQVPDEELADAQPESGHRSADAPASSAPTPTPAVGYLFGAGVLTPTALPTLLQRARIRPLIHPGDAPPEPRYVPSTALQDFVRCRDLTCRFPGCDRPAYRCDVDHAVPWPAGPTCASNLRCLCRKHHLLKTFWTGPTGWRDQQLPDGTIIWTSPTGQTYTTRPGSALLFPTLCMPTAPAPLKPEQVTSTERGLNMPKRRRTRAQNRARYIERERRLNDDFVAERTKPPPF
ncbi:HNH endonuclease signature motif containing protein [Mycolicibacterium baixiangningiae]|uniref:HNH endonuclease signature motif containing protein n=1 Tax=Mycolicibacterium baixiangningiae TaxID=2761578 RepID=UPI0018D03CC9|nr:HNH endonuclease signature motif containing protein [Mycolicibacterium baixiangningiae]